MAAGLGRHQLFEGDVLLLDEPRGGQHPLGDELDTELYRAFRRPRAPDAQVFTELARVAQALPDPVDRYWMVVYALVAEPPASVPSWRVIPFIGVMQAAFHITDTDMELATIDALTFPASLARPS